MFLQMEKNEGSYKYYPDKTFFPTRSQVINTGEEIVEIRLTCPSGLPYLVPHWMLTWFWAAGLNVSELELCLFDETEVKHSFSVLCS